MKHKITFEIDDGALNTSDERLALLWYVAQNNPAPHGDQAAGELAERIGREIIRRWLKNIEPPLWRHQGRDNSRQWLQEFAKWQPGEGYRSGAAFGDEDNQRAWYAGRWVLKEGLNGGSRADPA